MKKPAFSLIEVLVSSSLVFFLLCGTAQLILASLSAKRNAEFHLAATSLASSKLEYFKSLPFEDPVLGEGKQSEATRSAITGEILLSEWTIENISEGMKKVVITISREHSPSKNVVFVLLVCRELNF